jgi:hypothetical protein
MVYATFHMFLFELFTHITFRIYFNKIYDNDLTDSACAHLPTSYMVGPSNWLSLAHGSESGNNGNTQSNYVGFRISSDGGLSFGGSSSDIDDSGGFVVDDGRGHGSSHLANNISKSSSHRRTSLALGYMSISFLI